MTEDVANMTLPSQLDLQEVAFSKMNLFFIKSKHAFRQFKNHDYFENKRNQIIGKNVVKAREFVNSPAPFGVNNAYNYICTEVSRNLLAKSHYHQHRSKVCSVREETKTRAQSFMANTHRKTSYLLPNVSSQSRRTQTLLQPTMPSLLQPPSLVLPKADYQQNFLFIFRSQSMAPCFQTLELRLNIYSNIINTFLKSKINYLQMTQPQFNQLKGYILDIYSTEKEYVQYKDMVNIRSMREIFAELENPNRNQVYKRELVRYFFVANDKSYSYQLDRIKDQIKKIVGQQFKKDIGHEDVYLFAADDAREIVDLFGLLQYNGKLVITTDKQVFYDYRTYLHQKDVQSQLANRIKKWKSIAPEENGKSQSFKTMPDDRYQRLFVSVQRRRDKWMRNKKKGENGQKECQFIDRDKLNREENIFE